MNSFNQNTFIINSNNLIGNKTYSSEIIVNKSQSSIIRGEILDSTGKPLSNVVIEVTQIDLSTKQKNTIGYACTNSLGKYAFCLYIYPTMAYEFTAYSPL